MDAHACLSKALLMVWWWAKEQKGSRRVIYSLAVGQWLPASA